MKFEINFVKLNLKSNRIQDTSMQISVKTLIFGTITMVVKSNQTIADVRKMLNHKLDNLYDGYDIEMALGAERGAVYTFKSQELEDDKKLSDYNIQHECTIRTTFGLLGGGTYIHFQFFWDDFEFDFIWIYLIWINMIWFDFELI